MLLFFKDLLQGSILISVLSPKKQLDGGTVINPENNHES